jgi:hypothetical protein
MVASEAPTILSAEPRAQIISATSLLQTTIRFGGQGTSTERSEESVMVIIFVSETVCFSPESPHPAAKHISRVKTTTTDRFIIFLISFSSSNYLI